MVQFRVNRKSGRVDPQKNMGQVTGQPVFAFFFFKNGSGSGQVGLTHKKHESSHGLTRFCFR